MASVTIPGSGQRRLFPRLLIVLVPLALALIALLAVRGLVTTNGTAQPQKTLICINDKAEVCADVTTSVTYGTGGLVLVSSQLTCDDAVVGEALNFDLALVDGQMPGSQYQGVACVQQIIAHRTSPTRPVVVAFSTSNDLQSSMRAAGADSGINPMQGPRAYIALIKQLLGL